MSSCSTDAAEDIWNACSMLKCIVAAGGEAEEVDTVRIDKCLGVEEPVEFLRRNFCWNWHEEATDHALQEYIRFILEVQIPFVYKLTMIIVSRNASNGSIYCAFICLRAVLFDRCTVERADHRTPLLVIFLDGSSATSVEGDEERETVGGLL